jgi:hypothetical protein
MHRQASRRCPGDRVTTPAAAGRTVDHDANREHKRRPLPGGIKSRTRGPDLPRPAATAEGGEHGEWEDELGPGKPRRRRLARGKPDGADLELLYVISHENVEERFTRIGIGSDDGIFAAATASLAAHRRVTMVSRRQSLSARLRLAASDVINTDSAESISSAMRKPSRRPPNFRSNQRQPQNRATGPWTGMRDAQPKVPLTKLSRVSSIPHLHKTCSIRKPVGAAMRHTDMPAVRRLLAGRPSSPLRPRNLRAGERSE